LVPLLKDAIISSKGIVINSYSGVSGAGKKVAETFLYAERNESMVGYGTPKHRHLSEIEEQLSKFCDADCVVQFNPHLAPMTRGIATTIVVQAQGSIEDVYASWKKAYSEQPFIGLLPSGTFPDTKHVNGTNRADLSAAYDSRTGNFILHSVIDNLLKGASGQAIQIMNLKFGFPQTAGLLS
jgi:N-acetyl-gamma-glutamyl-phosphate reductase